MSTTTTPNMGLILPVPGSEPGPNYANEIVAAFNTLDGHNHAAGSGTPVPTAGLNINADLTMNGFNLTSTRSVRMSNGAVQPTAASDLACVYAYGGNLWFNDASGNRVQITASGAVNVASSGNISGMGSTTASVTYTSVNSTFTFLSATGQAANLAVGPIVQATNSAGSKTITFSPSASQAANYAITYPAAAPGNAQFQVSDGSGNQTWGSLAGTSNQVAVGYSGGTFTFSLPTNVTVSGAGSFGSLGVSGTATVGTLSTTTITAGGAGISFPADNVTVNGAVNAVYGFRTTVTDSPIKFRYYSGTLTASQTLDVAISGASFVVGATGFYGSVGFPMPVGAPGTSGPVYFGSTISSATVRVINSYSGGSQNFNMVVFYV